MTRSWTDEDLRSAIAASETWRDVCDHLGLSPGGSTRVRLRRRAAELGISADHVGHRPGGSFTRSWTDQQLVEAVARAENLRGVFEHLGLKVGGGSWTSMKEHIRRVDADLSHWSPHARSIVDTRPGSRPDVPAWTDAEIRDAYQGARSVGEVMRRLGLDPHLKRGRRALERRLRDLCLDTDALPGKGWSRGTSPDRRDRRRPLDEILVRDSDWKATAHLKVRLFEEGLLVPECGECGISRWQGRALTLQLDHVNGDRRDNRLENLRVLCPNCHSQTPTYCGRNQRLRYPS